ncbi:hypothetical protein [Amycolatopsis balhimycina]|uniref:hypothetical protein n=1 Tax=Amycolatopsis balhimycina TaxID=208443 RepID=UPI0003A12167|nr:hypothetical protein [Amycolatopsis balhimycina]
MDKVIAHDTGYPDAPPVVIWAKTTRRADDFTNYGEPTHDFRIEHATPHCQR